jgi:hypothetical protein
MPITYATFEFCHDRKTKHCKDDAPLSWHLNAHEKGAIDESWREHSPARSSDGVRKVLEFFGKSFTAG